MLKMSVYSNEPNDSSDMIVGIIRYAKEHELFVWKVERQDDAAYTENNDPTQCAVHVWLVDRFELKVLMAAERKGLDDIPF